LRDRRRQLYLSRVGRVSTKHEVWTSIDSNIVTNPRRRTPGTATEDGQTKGQ
ncbi:hypothetical protein V5799_011241, partial [Amblyomma americanum]